MPQLNLTSTKQGRQITELRSKLEKSGWTIIEEVERVFRGKPRWEISDWIPNYIKEVVFPELDLTKL